MNVSNKFWVLVIIFLTAVIVVSGTIAWSKYRPSQPIEITLKPPPEIEGVVAVSGAVNNPGVYPLRAGDTVKSLVQAAGGLTGEGNLANLELRVSQRDNSALAQKIDINRAELWLLKALPGIGDVKAQAIISYRRQNGPFRNVLELTGVEGISAALFDQIKTLITVSD